MAAPCRQIRRQRDVLAGAPALSPEGQDHLAACPRCARDVAAARLAAGLVRAAVTRTDPPAGFAARLGARAASVAGQPAADADVCRPAWGLLPAFAAMLGALLFLQQGAALPEPIGLFQTENLTPLERVLLTPGEVNPDTVLEAVLGEGEP